MKIVGIDGGIASVGWAVVDVDEDVGTFTIQGAGSRMFDAPETDKDRTPTNAIRRLHRGQRRVIRRRRQRMNEIRRLFHEASLLPNSKSDALSIKGVDPWRLRAEALTRALTGPELAVVLGHIARHRGFKSNAKRDAGANAANETSKMKKAIEATRQELHQKNYRTVGQMFATDEAFRDRKRNRGDFSRSVLRKDLADEVHVIFLEQQKRHNEFATDVLKDDFLRVAFFQRSLQDSEDKVAFCRFEPQERCTARRSYAFEMFRLLTKLTTLRLLAGGQEERLTDQQVARVAESFGETKGITFKALRKLLELDNRTRFVGVAEKDEGRDIVARSGSTAEGTWTLRHVVGPSEWRILMHNPVLRDRIAEVLTFREDPASIRQGLIDAGLEEPLLAAVMDGVEKGEFGQFSKAGHISAKAARALMPPLLRGCRYDEACKELGWDHAERNEVRLEDVRNPVARKAVTEILKQVRAIIEAHGLPDFIHVELARDVGKSADERDKITKGIEDQNKKRDKAREHFEELIGWPPSRDELLRYELWHEQGGFCLYTGDQIPCDWIVATDNRVQVDHILPWSRFGDDSFMNKTLCMAKANQDKRGRTPFEWFTAEGRDWPLFATRVERCKDMRGRKKGGYYLRRNADEVAERFRNRNLGDTRYATRLALGLLGRLYPSEGEPHVLARPGQLTAKLRRVWGLDDLKKDADGKRLPDDRHHALDAIVLASTTQSMLMKLTRAAQEAERQGLPRGFDFAEVPPPAAGFRDVVRQTVAQVFVSRTERRRARGEAHAATIKRIEAVDGTEKVFERKAIEKLTLDDLKKIPVPEPYGKVADPGKLRDQMVEELRRWIEAKKPKDALPCGPTGHVIRKVRVEAKDKVAVRVRGGTADRGDMVRVDVFSKPNKKGVAQFYLVPIYPHQIADFGSFPTAPDRAVVAYATEENWTPIDKNYKFEFSIYGNSLLEIAKSGGDVIVGYFKGLDRSTGAISIAAQHDPQNMKRGIGAKTLSSFRKLRIDRMGTITKVSQEVRTWHGVACT